MKFTYVFFLFQGIIGRLQILRLMPSHTQFYRKLDAYGKVHDKILKDIVKKESQKLEGRIDDDLPIQSSKQKEKHKLSAREESEKNLIAIKRIRESAQTAESENLLASLESPINVFQNYTASKIDNPQTDAPVPDNKNMTEKPISKILLAVTKEEKSYWITLTIIKSPTI